MPIQGTFAFSQPNLLSSNIYNNLVGLFKSLYILLLLIMITSHRSEAQFTKFPAPACSPPTSQLYSSTCIWQTFIAASALACDAGVTPAQHFASTDITTSGLTALIVMALLITQISVHTPTSSTSV